MSGQLSVPENAGVVATLVRGNEVVTIHKAGTPTFALRAVVRACDRYGWKVRTLSAPSTIFRDLAGSREYSPGGGGRKGWDVAMPERAMLRHIDRLDLLA